MAKKVSLNGVEIYTSAENISTDHFFDFVQEVMDSLEAELTSEDKKFHLKLQFRFYPDQNPKQHIHFNGLKNRRIREKVVKVLRHSTKIFTKENTGSVKIDLIVQGKK
jgi:DNA-directed RNA polymerase alpha subunit